MPSPIWIQPLESPLPLGNAFHLEVALDEPVFRCLRLARNWFAASPEPTLEVQGFRVAVTLLEQAGGETVTPGAFSVRPATLEPSGDVVASARLNVSRDRAWFEVTTQDHESLSTPLVAFDALLKLEASEAETNGAERTTQVTLALEITILHEGSFTGNALEELLNNLDFALEQQRNAASLAPESVDGVTQDFVFRDLDVRPGRPSESPEVQATGGDPA